MNCICSLMGTQNGASRYISVASEYILKMLANSTRIGHVTLLLNTSLMKLTVIFRLCFFHYYHFNIDTGGGKRYPGSEFLLHNHAGRGIFHAV